MVKSNSPLKLQLRDDDNSPLASLSRTLEALEVRLAKLTPVTKTASVVTAPAAMKQPAPASEDTAPRAAERRRSTLADAVSEIVMRRQMLDQAPHLAAPVRAPAPEARRMSAAAERGMGQRLEALAGDVEALRSEGSNYSLMAEVAEELQRLRQEMKAEANQRSDPRFDAMRDAFDALRRMIETRQSPQAIGDGMTEISESLARMTEEGADRSTLNTLRAELEELRGLFGDLAKERTLAAVGKRWEAFEDRLSVHAERETEARSDLKNELERLRESLRSLASEDQVRAVEKRWDEFEDRYLGASQPSDPAISQHLRDELEGLREKLEGISESAAVYGDPARWGAIEKHLDSREVEESIQRLADRMADIETVLAQLPQSLGIAPLEERIRSLSAGVDALANRTNEAEVENFVALEERLDEISRAIVATSLQPAPTLDMAPIERIEARIATLTARVDRIADDGDAEIMSLRIAELSDRVEELATNPAADALALRMADLADRLETAFTELEQPRIDTDAIEQRLSALAVRLEEAVQPRGDNELMRSLESQIARLSEHLANAGSLSDDFDAEVDRRLAVVEKRLDENREALIAAAREAADETALRMQVAGDRRQSEHVAQLSQSLRSLEQLSRETDDRSNKVFEAVHATLLKIVDRLEQIETDISGAEEPETDADNARHDRAAAHKAAASLGMASIRQEAPAAVLGLRSASARKLPEREDAQTVVAERPVGLAMSVGEDRSLEQLAAPSLDASDMIDRNEANRPLEPGSGMPDIGALLERVRLQQRSKLDGTNAPTGDAETRAAARRAAQAAVAEAEMLRAPNGAGSAESGKLNLAQRIARRRKTILAGVVAVIAALAALPYGKSLVDGDISAGTRVEAAAVPSAIVPPTVAPTIDMPAAPAVPAPAASDKRSAPVSAAAAIAPTAIARVTGTSSASGAGAVSYPAVAKAGPVPETTQTVLPVAPGKGEPTAETDARVILAGAIAKLPASASGAAPAVPTSIAAPALVAAAKAADPKAQFEIGLRMLEGRGAAPDAAAALDWFAQAARNGFAPAQYSLGTLFEKGNGVARDTGAARDWYLLAAKQGNIRAMHNLAVLYATGIEGKSDPETAASWFERAADHGMRDSQYNLGILYARGSGVDQSMPQSYKWFSIVAKAGDKDAEAKQKEVGDQLTPEQRKSADAEVSTWAPQERAEDANTVELPADWTEVKAEKTASVDMKRAVRNIQAILTKLGYPAGTPDGVLGNQTTTAIAKFQKDSGLTATGKIDEPLIRALLARKNG